MPTATYMIETVSHGGQQIAPRQFACANDDEALAFANVLARSNPMVRVRLGFRLVGEVTSSRQPHEITAPVENDVQHLAYRMEALGGPDGEPVSRMLLCEDDGAAMGFAATLARSHPVIKVWLGSRLVGQAIGGKGLRLTAASQ